MMILSDKYILRITAGPDYDAKTHVEVPVNKPEPLHIRGDGGDVELNVRIQNYKGLPRGSPSTSSYFSTEPHAYSQDQYSISLRFTPRRPSSTKEGDGCCSSDEPLGIKAADLQFGNDFDRPIRDRLPPGFNTAMNIVKWWIDPGLDGDAYADKPYLYGPALSSFNVLSIGAGTYDESKGGLWFEEGGDEEGMAVRRSIGAPKESKARMKWALSDHNKEKWIWEYGKTYGLDFFNPYLDFANLALRLPGFHLSVLRYLDGRSFGSDSRRSHHLRYVLRNRSTGEVYLVVVFSLLMKEDVNEDGTIKEMVEEHVIQNGDMNDTVNGHHNGIKASKEAREKPELVHEEVKTSTNDVD